MAVVGLLQRLGEALELLGEDERWNRLVDKAWNYAQLLREDGVRAERA